MDTMLLALAAITQVHATVETAPMPDPGDAADDVAIWVHPTDPARSTIIGTNKRGGLAVYDLAGRQLQYVKSGGMNNVDLRYGFPLLGGAVDVVAAGNRKTGAIEILRVEPESRNLVAAGSFEPGVALYGTCMYRSARGPYYVWITSKAGGVEQWELRGADGKVGAVRVRTLSFGGVTEGCVADDEAGVLYIAEEARGIWRLPADPGVEAPRKLIDSTAGGNLTPDVEGLALLSLPDGKGYLVASSQGSNDFMVYEREGANRPVLRFSIAAAGGIDGAEQTDGIDVTGRSLGPSFPGGLLVVQNGTNDGANQNFLLVPWASIGDPVRLAQAAGESQEPEPVAAPGAAPAPAKDAEAPAAN